MNSETKEDFTDTWWFLGICTVVVAIIATFAY